VHAVGAINFQPLGSGQSISLLDIEGHPFDDRLFFEERAVSPGYFAAMGIPLLAGRTFDDRDIEGHPAVAIVSQSFIRKYFLDGQALGKWVQYPPNYPNRNRSTIVGVVADVRQSDLETAPPMQIYRPLWQFGPTSASTIARTAQPPDRLASAARTVLRDLDPALALADVKTMTELVSASAAERRFRTFLLTVFGGIGLLLSLIGLYGLLAWWVQQRTAEIGIRMALGGQRRNILGLVLKQGFSLVLIGIAAGLAFSIALTRLLTGLLFEVTPTDPVAFLGAAVVFGAVALAACLVPAWHATRVDPLVALRDE
jgi:putative ABC transport system permease protein